jgi:sugar phosphate isomerase/epimerase
MQLELPGRPHLTYCSNIHPGESWSEVRANLRRYIPEVRERLGVAGPFGIGLRLSGRAAAELRQPGELESFAAWLETTGLYVFTLNGFPMGRFHGTRVKTDVYRPDWLEPDRVAYSDALARVLAALLPPGVDGSISTVPVAFRERVTSEAEAWQATRHIVRHVATLVKLAAETGKRIELALEPEPRCVLETTDEAVRFFEERLFSPRAAGWLAEDASVTPADARDLLRRHVGVCLDACHAAVEFEDPDEAVDRLGRAGIRVGKIQVTAGLEIEMTGDPADPRATALARFAEDVYLHQVVVRDARGLTRYLDLPEALAEVARHGPSTWRVHFHVPVFGAQVPPFRSTQPFVRRLLQRAGREGVTPHLEVETYTWDVLPSEHRGLPVAEAIARELAWTLRELGEP